MYRTKLLTDPKTFFEYYSDREGLTGPVVLMGCLVLVGLATSSIYIDWLTRDLPQRVATNVVLVRLIAAGISGFFVPPVLWVAYATAFHAISAYFDGEGSFRDTFKYTGWGLLPKLFGSLLIMAGMSVVVSSTPSPESAETVQRVASSVATAPYLVVARALNPVFTLWSGVIWVFAVAKARDMKLAEAAVTVGIPVAVSIALNVATSV